jgi:hypothetical protein
MATAPRQEAVHLGRGNYFIITTFLYDDLSETRWFMLEWNSLKLAWPLTLFP